VSAYGQPGSYDPLARPAEPPAKDNVIAHQRSLTTGIPPDLPRGATGANGHGDEGEKELVVVRDELPPACAASRRQPFGGDKMGRRPAAS
jgi:hypothetical protein